MAGSTGVTEIADSEEEPLTSSPVTVSDAAIDKLSAACQDAQAVACAHQESAEHTANQAPSRTDLSDVNQKKPSTDVEIRHYDQPDSRSAYETATDNANACPMQADSFPQAGLAAAGADQQAICTGTDLAVGEAGNLQDAGTSPAAKHASGLCERAISPMSQQIHLGEPQNEYHQSQLQKSSPTVSEIIDVHQDRPSKNCVQDQAVASHSTTLRPSQSDGVLVASIEQEPGRYGDACAISQEDIEVTENDCLAAQPSYNINDEATVTPPNFMHTGHLGVSANSGQTVPDTANVSDPMELDSRPGAADLTLSDATSGQHETALLSAPQVGLISTVGLQLQYVKKSATTSSAPPSGATPTTPPNDYKASDEASFAPGLSAQSKRKDVHDPFSEQCERDSQTHKPAINTLTLPEPASTQGSTTASNEQIREDVRPIKSENLAAGQPHEDPKQSLNDTVQAWYENGQAVEDDQSPPSKRTDVHTQSQSTASQASEPISPRLAAKLSPQEITVAELRAQKAALLGSLRVQPAIQVLMEENETSDVDISDNDGEPTEAEIMAAANKIVKEHIKLLHEYNELKDIGQGLMGVIADQRGVRIVEIQDEFGIDADD